MKTVVLSKEGCLKLKKKICRLQESDCQDLGKSYLPGEWIVLINLKEKLCYLGFINLHVEKNSPIIHILNQNNFLHEFSVFNSSNIKEIDNLQEDLVATTYITSQIDLGLQKRKYYRNLGDNFRLIYGESDHLPGLIVDKYEKYILLDINTEGINRFKNIIFDCLKSKFPDNEVLLHSANLGVDLDLNFATAPIVFNKVKLEENGIKIEVSGDKMQKIGYYYDHRSNRQRFENLIRNTNKNFNIGLDLFSYVGSWGLHLLRANVSFVKFIDQGDFKNDIENNLNANNFAINRGEFIRTSVFDYLDQQIEQNIFYDIIVSDPPAFAKSAKNREKALSGYCKLHEKILRILNNKSLVAICSCTNSVSFEDLDATMFEASCKVGREVNLIDIGFAGADHPINSLKDKSHYLKYLAYFVE